MHIIFQSVLMLFTKNYQNIKISPCLSKLQLATVGAFFETQCRTVLHFFRKSASDAGVPTELRCGTLRRVAE